MQTRIEVVGFFYLIKEYVKSNKKKRVGNNKVGVERYGNVK